ncbi:hypothetical protein B0H66DRAFT_297250 [Apodospora peruviana]|uniref:Zn(2)-C6 fungal-type domain-containing protein n=1 Tax=Apodospora peruviana TaxID=516989 RepID=A0AAE0M2E5_9PEZI|nr:hypothetical protein B0H66DRAFT_297250 [Apodospora peruviana]
MGKSHHKVKTGCRTCKTRKVKCDEGRPACRRCILTSRVCEGYGIWGGGNIETRKTHKPLDNRLTLRRNPPDQVLDVAEHGWVEWFRCRTAVKLQGPFVSHFWEGLVLSASRHEPAVFHAMLALSSHHKRVSIGAQEMGVEADPDRLEQFTLREYTKAISHLLEPQFASGDRASIRTALIACMLFICLEFLRGQTRTGNIHLQNGIKLVALLDQQQTGSNRDTTDDWLVIAFTRMNLLALQFGEGHWTPSPRLHLLPFNTNQPLPRTFETVSQAREALDCLLKDTINLCKEHRRQLDPTHPDQNAFRTNQQGIKSALETWLIAYKASRVVLFEEIGALPRAGYQMLAVHYTLVKIMADTSLRAPEDEMVFDSHTRDFVDMMVQATEFLEHVQAVHTSDDPVFRASACEGIRFTADMGWSPHLFYTAIHCRVRPVRLHAIRLLRAIPTREAIWDSFLAASAAQEIMRIEEGEDYSTLAAAVEDQPIFDITGVLMDSSFPTPIVPAWRRVYDVQFVLPDGGETSGKPTVMVCRRNRSDGQGYEVLTRKLKTVCSHKES